MVRIGAFDSWITADIPAEMVAPRSPLAITDFNTQLAVDDPWWWHEQAETPTPEDLDVVGDIKIYPAHHQALGLSINLYRPYFGSYVPMAAHIAEFRFDNYDHVLTTGIGFDSMSCSRGCSWEDAYKLFADACGAHVEVQDETGVIVWEGRVNSVGISAAGFTITRGPLSDVSNRCVVTYQLLDTTTNESQEQKRTDAADNTDSQKLYGVQYRVLSAGTITTATADQIRDVFVAINSWPKVPKQLSLGGGEVRVSLECLGYYHWLKYPYTLINVTGTQSVSSKIEDVLAADPNEFFVGTPNRIVENTLQVQRLEDQERAASEIIADLVALGDASLSRYTFGVWGGRGVRYEPTGTVIEYLQRTDDKRQVIENLGGEVVQPWAVLPGRWVAFTTLFPGELKGVTESDRNMFIESVRFSSPYGLTLSGGSVFKLSQALAQWGITGSV